MDRPDAIMAAENLRATVRALHDPWHDLGLRSEWYLLMAAMERVLLQGRSPEADTEVALLQAAFRDRLLDRAAAIHRRGV